MANPAHSSVFEKRREPHTIIIARGEKLYHFTVRPWFFIFTSILLALVATSVILSAGYLIFRDDLVAATATHNARMRQGYESRIALLRAQLDRVTSRQILDQELMETKVAELLQRQINLTERQNKLAPLIGTADASQFAEVEDTPLDFAAPDNDRATPALVPLGHTPTVQQSDPFSLLRLGNEEPNKNDKSALLTSGDEADRLFLFINNSLKEIEKKQEKRLSILVENLVGNVEQIEAALKSAGLTRYISLSADEAVGGPYIAIDDDAGFETKVSQLDLALMQFDRMVGYARQFPLANPSPGTPVSSTFGVRRDPLIGRPAMHAGMDFAVPTGTPVRATAEGTVVAAGSNGGYGNMIEIEHANGFTTRYAHLSRITVSEGQKVGTGDFIGHSGNTGRSTGPHLHYEIRRDGEAVNPLPFINAGYKISGIL
ncbi:M23 family metallopeptidase [Limoniibacter endophyticus]|uniref:Membrane protein n=1 Tax=Limoniibacter endophyticus TaxID=1565040 RepID=A0A8J3DP71_9HYPH|nr:M23 family metallopeptidase [Limoniibacter endophyticus]GHC62657.1 membrane protein [Limoniibacter endophyticus]